MWYMSKTDILICILISIIITITLVLNMIIATISLAQIKDYYSLTTGLPIHINGFISITFIELIVIVAIKEKSKKKDSRGFNL